jgi:hypothetical protein
VLTNRATPVTVARVGGRARCKAAAAAVGQQLIRTIRRRGEILEQFADAGLDVRAFVQHVIERLRAFQVKAAVYKGRFVYSKPLVDWATRTAAAEQYMRATGITTLPLEPGADDAGPLDGISDEVLGELAQILAEGQLPEPAA